MGTLMSPSNDTNRTIPPRLLIGRSAACGLQLQDPFVSSEHAAITWTGRHWEVHDLGSRNGTYVNDARIKPGSYVRLTPGARLAFGKKGQRQWTFVEDTAPAVMAVHTESKAVREGTQDLLILPDDLNPETSIFADSQNRWWIDTGNENIRPVKSKDIVSTASGFGGFTYRR
ncbi:MAG: FHA domain-containing protein, partial [Myxococcota bacterium]